MFLSPIFIAAMLRHACSRQLSNIIIIYALHYRLGKQMTCGDLYWCPAAASDIFQPMVKNDWGLNRMAAVFFTSNLGKCQDRKKNKQQVVRNEVVPPTFFVRSPVFISLSAFTVAIHSKHFLVFFSSFFFTFLALFSFALHLHSIGAPRTRHGGASQSKLK